MRRAPGRSRPRSRHRVEEDDEADDEADDDEAGERDGDAQQEHAALPLHPASASRSWSTCASGFTCASTRSIRPSAPTTNVLRSTPMYSRPMNFFWTHTPYASATRCPSSDSRRYGRRYFSLNFTWLFTLSGETPKTSASASATRDQLSRRPHACAVQPGVS